MTHRYKREVQKSFRGKSALYWLGRSTMDDSGTRWVTIPGYGNCDIGAVRSEADRWKVDALYIASMDGIVCYLEVGPRATSELNLDLIHEHKDARKRLGQLLGE